MAQKTAKQNRKKRAIRQDKSAKAAAASPFSIYLEKQNYLLIGAGFILLIIGFYLLSVGTWDSFESLTIAPLVLMAAYLIIFPLAIFGLFNKKKEKTVSEEESN